MHEADYVTPPGITSTARYNGNNREYHCFIVGAVRTVYITLA